MAYEDDLDPVTGDRPSYTVSAVDDCGESRPSPCVTAEPPRPPIAPRGLSARCDCEAVELAWSPPPDAQGFEIYRSTGEGAPMSLVGRSLRPVFVDAGAPAGESSTWFIRATDRCGESGDPARISAYRPSLVLPVPSAPTASVSCRGVDLEWSSDWVESRWLVERSLLGCQGGFLAIGEAASPTFLDPAPPSDRDLCYRLRARNECALGSPGLATPVPRLPACARGHDEPLER